MPKSPGLYEQEAEQLQAGALGHVGAAGDIGRSTGALGGAQGRIYRQNYQPIVQGLPSESTLDAPAILGQANVDVMGSFDKSKGTMQRDLARMGVSPSSGRWGGLEQKWALARAAAEAGAKTRARRMIREEEWARKLGLANFGQNMAGQAASTMGMGFKERMGVAGALGDAAGAADTSAYWGQSAENERRAALQRSLDAIANRAEESTAQAQQAIAQYRGRRAVTPEQPFGRP